MQKAEREVKKEYENNKKIVFIVSAVFLLFLAIFEFIMVSKTVEQQKIVENANFVEVEATIVEYKERIVDAYTHYSTYYEYRSPNGGIYSGCWQARIKTEEEAKAQIGKKVTIYVDEELHLQRKSLKVDKTGVIGGMVFACVCLLASLGFFISLAKQFVRWRNNREYLTEAKDKENNGTKPPKNFCYLHFAIMLVTFFMAVGSIGSSLSQEKNYQKYINANFVEVAGEICEYKQFMKDNTPYYATYYKYVSSDGQEFVNLWKNDIYTKKDAEAAIGSEVPLLYDKEYGVIKSMSDLEPVPKPDHTLNIILTVVFGVLFVNSLARFIRFIIRNERYKAEQKRQGITIE